MIRSKGTRCVQHKTGGGAMSLLRWLQVATPSDGATASANKEVQKVQEQAKRRKRGSYYHYDEETRAKIAKYSCDHGNKAAVSKFSTELGHVVTEWHTGVHLIELTFQHHSKTFLIV